MRANIAAVFCLAYILGLLLTGLPGVAAGLPVGMVVSLLLGVIAAGLGRRYWRGWPRWVWLAAGLMSLAAGLYFQLRLPQPSSTDICQILEPACRPAASAEARVFEVEGRVVSSPRLTRSHRLQFDLEATQVKSVEQVEQLAELAAPPNQLAPQPVSGKLYVTLPPALGKQLYPGLNVTVTGKLYAPKPASSPGGFDFEQYLARQGIFTGLNGRQLAYPSGNKPAPPLLWSVARQVVQVQERGLGHPEGALVSAMVMGKSAVDLPYDIQDQFKQTGLAHALAASGTQVTLLVGVILGLSQRLSSRLRLALGSGILLFYLGLTGLEPSVLRAGIMGIVALFALTANRNVKPLGSLLLAAVILLVYNPLWIWDLGFLLSFLATLGLLVTVPIISSWLDWLPSNLTPIFAIPIAAYLWTLPLMLATFGAVSPYSIPVNIIASPLIVIISIGGMISAVGALINPALGSLLASALYYPTHLFLSLAEFGSQLPGANVAVGRIQPAVVILLYGLIALVWRWPKLHRHWWLALIAGVALVAVPVGYSATSSQVTILATQRPVFVVQDRGRVGLIHSGDAKEAEFTVLPYLQQQGINRLDWAIAPRLKPAELSGWQQIFDRKLPQMFYSSPSFAEAALNQSYQALQAQVKTRQGTAMALSLGQKVQIGTASVAVISSKPDILSMRFGDKTWLWFEGTPSVSQQATLMRQLKPVDGIGWSGKALHPKFLAALRPKLAIAFGSTVDPATEQWLNQHQVRLHAMQQDGAVQLETASAEIN